MGDLKSDDFEDELQFFFNEVEAVANKSASGAPVDLQAYIEGEPASQGAKLPKLTGTAEEHVIRLTSQVHSSPFEVLLLEVDATEEDMKKRFRALSLLVHPDKCNHPKADEAFHVIQKAFQEAKTHQVHEAYDEVRAEAQRRVAKRRKRENRQRRAAGEELLPVDEASMSKEVLEMCRQMTEDLKVHRKYAYHTIKANERWVLQQYEEELQKEHDEMLMKKAWDSGRKDRVGDWRAFKQDRKRQKVTAGQSVNVTREQRKGEETEWMDAEARHFRPAGVDDSYKQDWR